MTAELRADVLASDVPFRFRVDLARDPSPRRASESLWSFIERSSWSEVELHRRDVERWVNDYPVAPRHRLLSRLGSRHDHHFRSAYSELFVHAVLRRIAGEVAIDPPTPSGGETDFRIESDDLDFEVVRLAPPDEMTARDRRIRDIEDAIGKVVSPDFALHVEVEASSQQPPSMVKVRSELAEWLAALDWSRERAWLEADQGYDPPRRTWPDRVDGWRVEVSAYPRKSDTRGTGPTIESRGYDPFTPTSDDLLRRLLGKREQHRHLARPLVIVADITNTWLKTDEVEQTLFGRVDGGTGHARVSRRPSPCLWPREGQIRQPIGVLVIQRLVLGFERDVSMRWYLNPDGRSVVLSGPWEAARLAADGLQVDVEPPALSLATMLDHPPLDSAAS